MKDATRRLLSPTNGILDRNSMQDSTSRFWASAKGKIAHTWKACWRLVRWDICCTSRPKRRWKEEFLDVANAAMIEREEKNSNGATCRTRSDESTREKQAGKRFPSSRQGCVDHGYCNLGLIMKENDSTCGAVPAEKDRWLGYPTERGKTKSGMQLMGVMSNRGQQTKGR